MVLLFHDEFIASVSLHLDRGTLVAENAEDALRVDHLADDADRFAGLDVPLVAVHS